MNTKTHRQCLGTDCKKMMPRSGPYWMCDHCRSNVNTALGETTTGGVKIFDLIGPREDRDATIVIRAAGGKSKILRKPGAQDQSARQPGNGESVLLHG